MPGKSVRLQAAKPAKFLQMSHLESGKVAEKNRMVVFRQGSAA
jgi:hypothetical protein